MIPVASFQQYLPIAELLRIIAVCVAVAVIAPASIALVITGFEVKESASGGGPRRLAGDLRIATGVLVIAAMIAVGIYAMASK